MKDYYPLLLKTALFQGIAGEELSSMLACLSPRVRSYPKGAAVLRAGEPALDAGIVLTGRVEICREDIQGNRAVLSSLSPGGIFAESYACARRTELPVSVWTQAPARILLLNVSRIICTCSSACAFHTRLIENLLQVLAEKNIALNEKLDCLSKRTLREKLLAYLEGQARAVGSASFSIPFDRQALADYLCADRSALSRELGRLRRAGILESDGKRFTLLQPPSGGA